MSLRQLEPSCARDPLNQPQLPGRLHRSIRKGLEYREIASSNHSHEASPINVKSSTVRKDFASIRIASLIQFAGAANAPSRQLPSIEPSPQLPPRAKTDGCDVHVHASMHIGCSLYVATTSHAFFPISFNIADGPVSR